MSHPLKHASRPEYGGSSKHLLRLAYFVSHPIQYQAPLLRRIAREPGLELTVFFGSDFSVRGYRDEGFGVEIAWDVPLLDGYRYEFLPRLRDKGTEGLFTPINYGLVSRLTDHRGMPRFDAVWVHGYGTVNQMHAILAAKALGIPVLVRSDSSLRDRPRGNLKLVAKQIFFQALRGLIDGVLVSGTWNMEYWRHYMGEEFPLFLLPYAVDNAWFQQRCSQAAATQQALRDELNLEAGRPVILFASKLQKRKHANDLIEAYSLICLESGPDPYLLIVGDGEEREALERRAAATGLTGIRFCGFRNQSELPRFFELASVFVLPSRHEPWGLVVNEVMNASRPVIVSDDVGCHPDLITDGVEGYVYPAGDVDALTLALGKVLASPEKSAEMGRAALARIRHWSFEEDVAGLKQALAYVTCRRFSAAAPAGQA